MTFTSSVKKGLREKGSPLLRVVEGRGQEPASAVSCNLAHCRVCLTIFSQNTGRGRPRKHCAGCEGRRGHVKLRLCAECGALVSLGNKSKFCLACANARNAARVGAYKADVKARRIASAGVTVKPCGRCGEPFAVVYKDRRLKFCSKSCEVKHRHQVHDPLRRARKRNARVEKVNPTVVFDRDGWRCQICQKRTPRRLRGTTADLAPELDHIVPLTRGGEHSYKNTQCACRKCNARKGKTIYGQVPLFAR